MKEVRKQEQTGEARGEHSSIQLPTFTQQSRPTSTLVNLTATSGLVSHRLPFGHQYNYAEEYLRCLQSVTVSPVSSGDRICTLVWKRLILPGLAAALQHESSREQARPEVAVRPQPERMDQKDHSTWVTLRNPEGVCYVWLVYPEADGRTSPSLLGNRIL